MIWYSDLVKSFPQVCCEPHRGFSVVNEAEVDVFLESLAFSMLVLQMLAI